MERIQNGLRQFFHTIGIHVNDSGYLSDTLEISTTPGVLVVVILADTAINIAIGCAICHWLIH